MASARAANIGGGVVVLVVIVIGVILFTIVMVLEDGRVCGGRLLLPGKDMTLSVDDEISGGSGCIN